MFQDMYIIIISPPNLLWVQRLNGYFQARETFCSDTNPK